MKLVELLLLSSLAFVLMALLVYLWPRHSLEIPTDPERAQRDWNHEDGPHPNASHVYSLLDGTHTHSLVPSPSRFLILQNGGTLRFGTNGQDVVLETSWGEGVVILPWKDLKKVVEILEMNKREAHEDDGH